jgi:uncharacterized protein (DUF3084 family)
VSSASRFPAAVTGYVVALASARFHLRPRQHGVVLHLRGGRAFARSLSATTLAVIVTASSGKRSLRYVAGQAHLRA